MTLKSLYFLVYYPVIMDTNENKPHIYEYSNYRFFLQDMYKHLKLTSRAFSFRYFSRKAGFRSPNFYKLVMDGQRNLSGESVMKFAKALKLNPSETKFFHNLVMMQQSDNLEEKKHYTELVLKSKSYRKAHPLSKDQFDYLSQWYVIPIREMLCLKGFQGDSQWIASQLQPEITPTQASEALELLQKLGLAKENADGTWQQTDRIISTGDEIESIAAVQYHKQMIEKAAGSLTQSPETRDVSSVTLTLSEETYKKLRSRIRDFRKELLAIAEAEQDPENVYQMNFQVFPLTKTTLDS